MANLKGFGVAIGELDEEIVFRKYTETRDKYGGATKTWTTHATEWARVEYPATGTGEKYMADEKTAFQRVVFTIRHRGDLDAKMVVQYDGKEYDIEGIAKIGRFAFETITTKMRAE